IADLMPANLVPAATGTQDQLQVGQRFTADSWDVKQFALPYAGFGPDGMPGRAGVDDDGDGNVDMITVNGVKYPDPKELGWPGSDDVRAWEFNVDVDGDG